MVRLIYCMACMHAPMRRCSRCDSLHAQTCNVVCDALQRLDQERERQFHQGLQRPSTAQQPSLGAWGNPQSGDKRPHSHISESPQQPGHPQSGHSQPPKQPTGLSQFQQHQIQQVYANLMQHPKQPQSEEGPSRNQGQPQNEPNYPLQPVPSRLGPNSGLSLPSYNRMLPQLTTNDLDTIVKLRQQLSGENGLLTRLSSFMQAQRSTDQRHIAGMSCTPPIHCLPTFVLQCMCNVRTACSLSCCCSLQQGTALLACCAVLFCAVLCYDDVVLLLPV